VGIRQKPAPRIGIQQQVKTKPGILDCCYSALVGGAELTPTRRRHCVRHLGGDGITYVLLREGVIGEEALWELLREQRLP
jgi:hypothetical protein